MIRLLGRAESSNVAKVLWTLEEIGIPYTHESVGGPFGGNDTAAYLALNPHGRVPTLVDGEVVVWESNAVVRYLTARYAAGTLWPEDAGKRAVADGWMDWTSMSLGPALTAARKALSTAGEASARAALSPMVRILEQRLAGQPFIAGPGLSIGDIPLGGLVGRILALPPAEAATPALVRYFERLCARPAFGIVRSSLRI